MNSSHQYQPPRNEYPGVIDPLYNYFSFMPPIHASLYQNNPQLYTQPCVPNQPNPCPLPLMQHFHQPSVYETPTITIPNTTSSVREKKPLKIFHPSTREEVRLPNTHTQNNVPKVEPVIGRSPLKLVVKDPPCEHDEKHAPLLVKKSLPTNIKNELDVEIDKSLIPVTSTSCTAQNDNITDYAESVKPCDTNDDKDFKVESNVLSNNFKDNKYDENQSMEESSNVDHVNQYCGNELLTLRKDTEIASNVKMSIIKSEDNLIVQSDNKSDYVESVVPTDIDDEIESNLVISDSDKKDSDDNDQLIEELSNIDNVKRYNRNKLLILRKLTEIAFPDNIKPLSPCSINIQRRNNYRVHRRFITLKTDVKLEDVEGAYKPAHLRQMEDKKEDRTALLTRELNILLNRLLDDTLPEIVNEIKILAISGREEMTVLVKVLTTKATRNTKYCEVFSKLCVNLTETKKFEGFKMILLTAVNQMFETSLQTHLDQLQIKIDEKINATNDEKVKKMLEEDRETAISKKKEAFLGVIQFFSQLYLLGIVSEKSAAESLKSYSKPKTQDDVLALLTSLNTCGQKLEKKLPNIFKDCLSGLDNAKKDIKMEQHVLFKIDTLIELRDRQWKQLDPNTRVNNVPKSFPKTQDCRREPVNRRSQPLVPRKTPDSQTINLKCLTLSGQKNGPNEKFLGPPQSGRCAWSKGSSSQNITVRNSKYAELLNPSSETESESGRDSRPSSASMKKHIATVNILKTKQEKQYDVDTAILVAIDAFRLNDKPDINISVEEKEKKNFVKQLLCQYIERKPLDRKLATNVIAQLYQKGQLSDSQVIQGYLDLLKTCEEIRLDMPKIDEYVAEFLTALVSKKSENVNIIIKILDGLVEEQKSSILAFCLHLSSKQHGEDCILNVFKNSKINWKSFKQPVFNNFAMQHKIEFLVELQNSKSNSTKDQLNKNVIEEALKNHNFEKLRLLFNEVNAGDLNKRTKEEYLNQLVSFSIRPRRAEIDEIVQLVRILIDNLSDGEQYFLLKLQNAQLDVDVFKQWLMSLIQFKIISKESIQLYSVNKSGDRRYKDIAICVLKKR